MALDKTLASCLISLAICLHFDLMINAQILRQKSLQLSKQMPIVQAKPDGGHHLSSGTTLAERKPAITTPLQGYVLNFGDCQGYDIDGAGKGISNVDECADICTALPTCKVFLWLGPFGTEDNRINGLCLPKTFACPPKRQHEGDANFMLYIKSAEYWMLQHLPPVTEPTVSALHIHGYTLEYGDCSSFTIDIGTEKQLAIVEASQCASVCSAMKRCKMFLWLNPSFYDKLQNGTCLLKSWACPKAREHEGEPGFMLYIKNDVQRYLQTQKTFDPQKQLKTMSVPGYGLHTGNCPGDDLMVFGTTAQAGKEMGTVDQCATLCNSLAKCKLFVWLDPTYYDKRKNGLCLPKSTVCPPPKDSADDTSNYFLYIKEQQPHPSLPAGAKVLPKQQRREKVVVQVKSQPEQFMYLSDSQKYSQNQPAPNPQNPKR